MVGLTNGLASAAGTRYRLVTSSDLALEVLEANKGSTRSYPGSLAIRFDSDAPDAYEGDDLEMANVISAFTRVEWTGGTQFEEEQVDALVKCMESVSQTGGSTCAAVGTAVRQGLSDMAGRSGADIETRALAFAVSAIMEAVLAKANLNEVTRLGVLGRVVARQLAGQDWNGDSLNRTAAFSEAVGRFLDGGCGFGGATWFEVGQQQVAADTAVNLVPNFYPASLENDLVQELDEKRADEREKRVEEAKTGDALAQARSDHRVAAEEARFARTLRVTVANELLLVRRKRRRSKAR